MCNVNDTIRNCEHENNIFSIREIVLEFEVKKKDKSFQCTLLTDSGCNETNTAPCVEENPDCDYVWERLHDIKPTIHTIEEIGENINIKKTYKDFKEYRLRRDRACSRLNRCSPVMYVGTFTSGGVGRRIQQQMGNGNPQTSSLHLKYWFTGKCRITIRQYNLSRQELNDLSKKEQNDLLRERLNIIKRCLFDRLKPAFGGRADNNR